MLHIILTRLLQRLHFRQYGKTPKISQFLSQTMTIDLFQYYLFYQKSLKTLSSQIQLYLANNSLLDEKQSGFRKKRSCITPITNIFKDIRQILDCNCVTFLTLLDHNKAFDSVNSLYQA